MGFVNATTPAAVGNSLIRRDASARRQKLQQEQRQQGQEAAFEGDEEHSLDESMDSHFSYIQQVSAPQELEQLLPRLQAVLNQVQCMCALVFVGQVITSPHVHRIMMSHAQL